ncbi:DUF2851 family protein [Flagellimonas sediminis]|uniref:DUF2851 family protein n=1 Tax=Flagellimonas sediminis TaxID=2696468 RepID=A0A6I5KXL6_9FLAO|nr:DUF2851 family protein [Allomuricauda sediminis]NDV44539.1 DUF2851 family protein [Allomuricauda sediminis]
MREDLLHFIWRHNKLPTNQLCTTDEEPVLVKSAGVQNRHSGPDFFNASVAIDGQLWAGNVEMHLKSSDWYAHHHENDTNYDNVILHVVWEDDVVVFRRDGSKIPTLEIRNFIPKELLAKYTALMEHSRTGFINCEKDFGGVDPFLLESWLHRLYMERLEHKSELIFELLNKTKNNWEAVLFTLLAKNFGSKVNGQFFLDRATELDFAMVRKTGQDLHQLESLLLGHFGLLNEPDCTDGYYLQLVKEYHYLSNKFELPRSMSKPEYFGLRPPNFPTIRVSQLAHLYHHEIQLFSKCMETSSLKELYDLFDVEAGPYWDTHFTFGKLSRKSTKKLSRKFIDLLVVNTLIPLKFCHAKYQGQEVDEGLVGLLSEVGKEDNSVIANFDGLGHKTKNAFESQAKLELYNNYCSKNKCLQCVVGTHLLNRNT